MGSMDYYSRLFDSRFFLQLRPKTRNYRSALPGPYGEFFDKVLDLGHSYQLQGF